MAEKDRSELLEDLYETAETAPWMENDDDTNERQDILWDLSEFGTDGLSNLPNATESILYKDAVKLGFDLSKTADFTEVVRIVSNHANMM